MRKGSTYFSRRSRMASLGMLVTWLPARTTCVRRLSSHAAAHPARSALATRHCLCRTNVRHHLRCAVLRGPNMFNRHAGEVCTPALVYAVDVEQERGECSTNCRDVFRGSDSWTIVLKRFNRM